MDPIVRTYVNSVREHEAGDSYLEAFHEMVRILNEWKPDWMNVQIRDDNLESKDKILFGFQLIGHMQGDVALVCVSYAFVSHGVCTEVWKCHMNGGDAVKLKGYVLTGVQ